MTIQQLPAVVDEARMPRRGMSRANLDEFATRIRRVAEILLHGAIALVVRVSTQTQFKESTGSLAFQDRQLRHVEPYGVDLNTVERYISVESAHGVDERPDFERLLLRILSGHVRMVIAAFADRISRN